MALPLPRPRLITRINERLAVSATKVFGTMWAFYVLSVYGLMPLLFPGAIDRLLYWSNVIQLVALPLLAVGQQVLGRGAERQSAETHDAVLESRDTVREEVALIREDHEAMAVLVAELHAHFLGPGESGGAP